MNDEIFTASWIRPAAELPANGTKCLVTDGNVVVTATYILEQDNSSIWILEGINDAKKFDVQAWMPLPKPVAKIVPFNKDNPELLN
jgi:hypothetical protein